MKRIFFAIVIVLIGLTAFTADPPGTKVPIGLIVGAGKTKTVIDTTELKRIKDIDDKIDNSTLGSSLDNFYNQTQSNSRFINEDGDTITGIINIPTAAAGTNSTQVINAKYANANTRFSYGLSAIGSTIKGQTIGSTLTGLTTFTLTDGKLYMVLLDPMPTGTVITGLKLQNAVAQASFTEDNFNGVALFKVMNDGTYSRVAISSDLTAQFKLAYTNTAVFPFTSPYTTEDAMYVAAILYNSSAQTTAPSFFAISAASQPLRLFISANANIICSLSAQTSIPSTVTLSGTSVVESNPLLFIAY